MSENVKKVTVDTQHLRCQASCGNGSCPNQVFADGCKYCAIHGGTKEQAAIERKNMNLYRIAVYQSRLNEFMKHDQATTLRNELGLTRMMLEEILNKAGTMDQVALMYFQPAMQLIQAIQKLVESCQKLDKASGQLLDRTQLLVIANTIIKILAENLNDQALLDKIQQELITAITAEIR